MQWEVPVFGACIKFVTEQPKTVTIRCYSIDQVLMEA